MKFLDDTGLSYFFSKLNNKFVHKTGDESIFGVKTFNDSIILNGDVDIHKFSNDGYLRLCGGSSASYTNGAKLVLYGSSEPSKANYFSLFTGGSSGYKVLTGTPSGDLTWDSNDITGDVHKTGDETIGGSKTFTSSINLRLANPYLILQETDIERGKASTGTSYQGIYFEDKNANAFGSIIGQVLGDGIGYRISFRPRYFNGTSSSEALIACAYNAAGEKYFSPLTNGDVFLGISSNRWKEVWCSQSSLNTSSDERIKADIAPIPDRVLDAWAGVEWKQFKYRDALAEKGSSARLHSGAIAQQIDRAFRNEGLDASAYGLFLHDSWEATPEERDPDGRVSIPARPAGDEYGLRYVEALCMEAAYLRRENVCLKKRVADLEERLAALELKIS